MIDWGKIEQPIVDEEATMRPGVQLQVVDGKIHYTYWFLERGTKLEITNENVVAVTVARIFLDIVCDKANPR